MSLVVATEQGAVRGVLCDNEEAKYVAFKGIPYAKQPLGELRFKWSGSDCILAIRPQPRRNEVVMKCDVPREKAPEPPEPWEGVRNAMEHGPVCPQYNERMGRMEAGSEDCLYLNVYTSSVGAGGVAPRPVMVWIHGGGFYTGSGNSDFYGPEFFMAHDVIFVTFNYRLEVLGFLCLEIDEAPGNAGMKDQVAALKWVKQNIAAFGGDPNNITIFGCSAGAASVSFHLISEMSKGLFNKAICQSGVCLNDWSHSPYGKERAFQLGKALGKETEDPKELLEFLKTVPVESITNVQLPPLNVPHPDITDIIMFCPVVEKVGPKEKRFLSKSPLDYVKNKEIADVPIIVGYTSGEGIEITRKLPTIIDFFSSLGAVVPRELKFKLTPERLKETDAQVREYYFKSSEVSMDTISHLTKLETDELFSYNIRRFARYHSLFSNNSTYLYKFVAETERNYCKKHYKMESLEGVCHADDLHYLFYVRNLDIPLTDGSRSIIKYFVQLWVDFSRTGNPTPNISTAITHWKPFKETERNYYIIGKTPFMSCVCHQSEEEQRMSFWEKIYEETDLTDLHNSKAVLENV